jgi:hypothetical protein
MTPDGIGGTSTSPHTPHGGSPRNAAGWLVEQGDCGWVVSGAGRLLPSTDEFSIPLLPPGRL